MMKKIHSNKPTPLPSPPSASISPQPPVPHLPIRHTSIHIHALFWRKTRNFQTNFRRFTGSMVEPLQPHFSSIISTLVFAMGKQTLNTRRCNGCKNCLLKYFFWGEKNRKLFTEIHEKESKTLNPNASLASFFCCC